ncbi:MAG: hypothetical protein JW918_18275 [Anaerolineae bacterium]|nr:hypothetical protein [Anaerolineae bacterium]
MERKPGDSNGEPKRTVRVQRRRRSERTGAEGRERAQTPHRRRSDYGGETPPSSTRTGEPSAVDQMPVGRSMLPIAGRLLGGRRISPLVIVLLILLVICVVCAIVFVLSRGMGDFAGDLTSFTPAPFQTEAPLETAKPFVPPTASATGQTWLVMLYQDADDKILEQDIYLDLNEAERVGSGDGVHIVAQIDRYRGGYRGDADWFSAKRFYVTQDDDLQRVHSQLAADLGEVNMSDSGTLVDFVTWAVETLPADRYVLILSDHGMGWPGGWSDPAPGGRGDPSLPLSSALGDQLYLMEIDAALGEIREQTGLEEFELIGMDACLMGHLEVFTALAPHARYAVASQETEPALGWAYAEFLEELKNNPDMDGAELGRLIVESYIQDDQRIVDDQARAEFLRQGSPMGGPFGPYGDVSADQLAQQMAQNVTLAAVDLQAVPELLDSVNDLSYALQGEKQIVVARARSYAQSFTSVFGRTIPPSYIDLGHFTQLVRQESRDTDVIQAADHVLASLNRAVIAERHGPKKPGATGISIYFPNSQLYQSPAAGPQSYTVAARRFAELSLWDDFLAFHYTGRPFEPSTGAVVIPGAGASVSGPGAGGIKVSSITLSDSVAAPGRPVLLSADISGPNVGYVYLFVGFYDQASNAIFVADTDYLESADTREIDGVYYPAWGEGAFTMEFEWEPIVFAIDDGVDSVVAHFTPQSYGVSYEQAVYSVDGIYTYADSGESRYARLYFSDGVLRQVFGFTGEGGVGAPREIIPQTGDTFTVLEKWLDLDARGNVAQVSAQEGGTLTFHDRMFTWEELDAAPGAYIVGFIVEDLDGNQYAEYTQVMVE